MGAWKKWIVYILTAVEQTAMNTNRMIDEILEQMYTTLEYGKKQLNWYNKEVNEAIFTQPYFKPRLIGEILSISSRTTLTKYMAQLTELGIVSPKEDWKDVYYLNNDLIRILEA
jgi:Fic family protein